MGTQTPGPVYTPEPEAAPETATEAEAEVSETEAPKEATDGGQ